MTSVPCLAEDAGEEILDERCQFFLAQGNSILLSAIQKCMLLGADMETVLLLQRNAETVKKIVALSDGGGADDRRSLERLLNALAVVCREFNYIKEWGLILAEFLHGYEKQCGKFLASKSGVVFLASSFQTTRQGWGKKRYCVESELRSFFYPG